MEGNPPPLEYAPRPSGSRRAKRRIIAVTCILIVGGLGWRHGPYAWWYLQVLYWQNRCFNYVPPPQQLISSEAGNFVPQPWKQLYATLYAPGVPTSGTLFVHERRSPGGHVRLVVIDTRLFFDGTDTVLQPIARVFRAGSAVRVVEELPAPVSSQSALAKADKLFVGTIDPENPSHFTINGISEGHEMVIDGWLEDDDRVLLEPRPAAATGQATRPAN